jgi:hypothetical protein
MGLASLRRGSVLAVITPQLHPIFYTRLQIKLIIFIVDADGRQ